MMDATSPNDDVPPPYDGPATTPEYTPLGTTDINPKAHQDHLTREESVFLPTRLRRRSSLWPSPFRILSSAISVCRRALFIWSSPVKEAYQPPPATEDRLEVALADASAKSRMMHLLALLVALICDSEASATPFNITEFRERWEEPCIARLRDYQDSGIISPAISDEIDAFCEFMNNAAVIIQTCAVEEAERIANMCWVAMNENNFHKLYLPLPDAEIHMLSPDEPGADLLAHETDDAKRPSFTKMNIAAEESGPSLKLTPDTLAPPFDDMKLPPILATDETVESFKHPPSSLPSSSSLESNARSAHDHIRSIMSNVLGEFCALISEDNLDLDDFRDRWYEPAIVQILDAMQNGVLQSEEKLRRDASSWLRFLRAAMASLEQDGKYGTKDAHEYAPECSRTDIIRRRREREERQQFRNHIAAKGRTAYFSDDYDMLRS